MANVATADVLGSGKPNANKSVTTSGIASALANTGIANVPSPNAVMNTAASSAASTPRSTPTGSNGGYQYEQARTPATAPAARTSYSQATGNTWEDTNALARAMQTQTGGGFDDLNPNPDGGGGGGGGGYRSSGTSAKTGASYSAPTLPHATDQSAYINAMYAANEQAARDNLRAEYENNLAQLDYQQGRLPETYNAAVDQANAQSTINRLNFNEAAAANGLNTGAGSQVRLSQNNALLNNVSAIRKAQADAQAELDLQRTQMEQQYQQAIREAVAKNDLERAQALYQEAKRVDESIVNTAINQANLNWSVWRSLYG